VAFSPDGKIIASGGEGRMVRIWDAATGKQIQELPVYESTDKEQPDVTSVVFSPNGKVLAARVTGKPIIFWDPDTGKKLSLSIPADSAPWSIAFSPDSDKLAVVNANAIDIWRLSIEKIITNFSQNPARHIGYAGDFSTRAIFSPDATLLGTNSGVIWKLATGEKFMSGLELVSRQIAFSPDGKRLFTIGGTVVRTSPQKKVPYGQITAWNLETKTQQFQYTDKEPSVFFCMAVSPDGKTIAIGGAIDSNVRLLDLSTLNLSGLLKGHTDQIVGLSFSPDGKKLASASLDKTVLIWNLETDVTKPDAN
jgi:WD40 repeat protein